MGGWKLLSYVCLINQIKWKSSRFLRLWFGPGSMSLLPNSIDQSELETQPRPSPIDARSYKVIVKKNVYMEREKCSHFYNLQHAAFCLLLRHAKYTHPFLRTLKVSCKVGITLKVQDFGVISG